MVNFEDKQSMHKLSSACIPNANYQTIIGKLATKARLKSRAITGSEKEVEILFQLRSLGMG